MSAFNLSPGSGDDPVRRFEAKVEAIHQAASSRNERALNTHLDELCWAVIGRPMPRPVRIAGLRKGGTG